MLPASGIAGKRWKKYLCCLLIFPDAQKQYYPGLWRWESLIPERRMLGFALQTMTLRGEMASLTPERRMLDFALQTMILRGKR